MQQKFLMQVEGQISAAGTIVAPSLLVTIFNT